MYRYEDVKPRVFLEENQKQFLEFRDKVNNVLEISGAFTQEAITRGMSGDSWLHLAYIDRLVELKRIKKVYSGEVTNFDVYTLRCD